MLARLEADLTTCEQILAAADTMPDAGGSGADTDPAGHTTGHTTAIPTGDLDALIAVLTAHPWAPPNNIGPIQPSQHVRLAALIARQTRVIEALERRIVSRKQHHDVTSRMAQTPTRPRAAFIDQTL